MEAQRAEIELEAGDAATAIASLDRAVSIWPDNYDANNRLAFLLSASSDPALLDPARAVELAERATSERREFGSLSTLAAAYAAAGSFPAAIATTREAQELAVKANDARAIAALEQQLRLYSEAAGERQRRSEVTGLRASPARRDSRVAPTSMRRARSVSARSARRAGRASRALRGRFEVARRRLRGGARPQQRGLLAAGIAADLLDQRTRFGAVAQRRIAGRRERPRQPIAHRNQRRIETQRGAQLCERLGRRSVLEQAEPEVGMRDRSIRLEFHRAPEMPDRGASVAAAELDFGERSVGTREQRIERDRAFEARLRPALRRRCRDATTARLKCSSAWSGASCDAPLERAAAPPRSGHASSSARPRLL